MQKVIHGISVGPLLVVVVVVVVVAAAGEVGSFPESRHYNRSTNSVRDIPFSPWIDSLLR